MNQTWKELEVGSPSSPKQQANWSQYTENCSGIVGAVHRKFPKHNFVRSAQKTAACTIVSSDSAVHAALGAGRMQRDDYTVGRFFGGLSLMYGHIYSWPYIRPAVY